MEEKKMIRFKCGGCGAILKVKEEHAGKKAKCSRCGIQIIIPKPETAPVKMTVPSVSSRPAIEQTKPSSSVPVQKTNTSTPVYSDTDSKMNNTGIKKSKKSNKSWLILILIIVLASAGLLAATRSSGGVSSSVSTIAVERSKLTVTVTEAGSITAHRSVEYECEVERRGMGQGSTDITILEIVDQGTVVTQEDVDNGFVLCRLDKAALEDQLVSEEMQLTSANESVISYREAYEIQILDNESSLSNAKLGLRFSLLDLQKYLGAELAEKLIEDANSAENLTAHIAPFIEEVRNDPNILAGSSAGQSLKQLQDNITSNRGSLATAQMTLNGTLELFDANFVSELERLQDELNLQRSEFALNNAQINYNLFLDYDFPKNAEQYLSNYIEDLRNLERIDAQCRSRIAQAKSRLASAEETFADQQEQVNLIKRQIESCTIVARSTGMVVYGTGSTSDTYRMMRGMRGGGGGGSSGTIAEGETVSPGQVIISIPDTSTWIAEVSVHETDVSKVRAGQAAKITMDAFPEETLDGVVTEVAPLPDEQRNMMNPDLKVYATKVRIDGSHDFLKAKMTCKVEILVNRVVDAIIVPVTVVASNSGSKFCYVLNSSGKSEKREVSTGLFNDIYVEIKEGLEEGEKVLLNPPVETEMLEIDQFEGIEALPAEQGSGVGREAGSMGQRGGMQGMQDMNPEDFQQMMDEFGGRGGFGGEGGSGRSGGGRGGGGRGGGMGGFGGGAGGRGG